jgi:hypothetical protein
MTPRDTAPSPPAPLPSGEGGAAARVRVHSVAIAAQGLNPLRETWLNPPEWTERRPTSADF